MRRVLLIIRQTSLLFIKYNILYLQKQKNNLMKKLYPALLALLLLASFSSMAQKGPYLGVAITEQSPLSPTRTIMAVRNWIIKIQWVLATTLILDMTSPIISV